MRSLPQTDTQVNTSHAPSAPGAYNLQDGRTERALILLHSATVAPTGQPGVYTVASQEKAGQRYQVRTADAGRSCECHDWAHRAPQPCKHIIAAEVSTAIADIKRQIARGTDAELIYSDLMAMATGDDHNTYGGMLDAYLVAIAQVVNPPIEWRDMREIVGAAETLSQVPYEIHQYRSHQFAYTVRPRTPFRARYPWFMVYGSYEHCYVANSTWKWAATHTGDHVQALADAAEAMIAEKRIRDRADAAEAMRDLFGD